MWGGHKLAGDSGVKDQAIMEYLCAAVRSQELKLQSQELQPAEHTWSCSCGSCGGRGSNSRSKDSSSSSSNNRSSQSGGNRSSSSNSSRYNSSSNKTDSSCSNRSHYGRFSVSLTIHVVSKIS
ncbi:hypothetical protein FHG87_001659 [Trinorchestia longiramus]|nr:hypothetical protein FHG87_001659 [Trinorchestia longiramus]